MSSGGGGRDRRATDFGGRPPTVSIGLAVFNGHDFLREAIDSILAQTFRDFELIICDNASTDDTETIAREYAEQDQRVRYYRNSTNIGGARNENLTFRYARGRYFRWAAHDDVLAPTLLERCVEVLEAEPGVVLCHPEVVVIDGDGRVIGGVDRHGDDELSTWRHFLKIANVNSGCEETYGLMRSETLAITGLQRNYTDSDRTLLAHMRLLGSYREVREALFFKRVHPDNSMQRYPEWRERMRWFGPDFETRINLPHWSQMSHYLGVITAVKLPITTKLQCYRVMMIWIVTNRRWRSLIKDIILACDQLLKRSMRRWA